MTKKSVLPTEYQVKSCSCCKRNKNVYSFNKDAKASTGYQSWCRACINMYHTLTAIMREEDKATTSLRSVEIMAVEGQKD